MNVDPAQVRAIFLEAVEKQIPKTWDQFLDQACTGDGELRRQVARLLDAHRQAESFLADGAVAPGKAIGQPSVQESPGTVIGPYKLLEQIGEGGFGVVFMAEQSAPIRRKVALKILKAGMDTRLVVARFEAERQALALMDHPNIARVFDGGATAFGRPYFVMELVKGVPITDFCDQNHLTLRQRLELFIPVCQAVQHAHLKGLIHRDLKPTNVLVSRHDTTPIVKIIDFGVAKALGQELTDRTLFTGLTEMIGTPLYMSPEQAGKSDLDIDTRSDIYSLGVLLYELLTGTTPFDKERFKQAAYDEIRRIIREEDPPRPSTRISTLRQTATPVSTQRQTEPAELAKLVGGELDWIVMKCLEKDRNRRYETANAFVADLERYLADEPVQACPPSTWYRCRKFTQRNKAAVLAGTAIILLLCFGIVGTTWGLLRAERARAIAEAALVSERAAKEAEAEQRNLATAAAQKASREAAVAAVINDFFNKDILQMSSPLGQVVGGVSPDANLKLRTVLERASKQIDGKFPNEPDVEMRLRYTIGWALQSVGDSASALPQYEKVVAYSRQLLGRDHAYTLKAEYRVASTHRLLHHFDVAVPLLEENVERHKTILGPNHEETFQVMNGLAMAYYFAGQTDKALALAAETLELRKRHLDPSDIDILVSMNNLAALHLWLKQIETALPLFEETLAGMKLKLEPLHPERLTTTRLLAETYQAAEQPDKALALEEMLVGQFKTAYGVDYPMTQSRIDALIGCSVDLGLCDKATALLVSMQTGGANRPATVDQQQAAREGRFSDLIQRVKPSADLYQQELAATKADHPDTLAAQQAFAVALRDQKRLSGAAYHLKSVLDARQRLLGADHPDTQATRLELGATRVQQQKYAEAEPLMLAAYTGLKQHETGEAKSRAAEALERLVQLYDGWGKKDQATEWRQKLEKQKRQ